MQKPLNYKVPDQRVSKMTFTNTHTHTSFIALGCCIRKITFLTYPQIRSLQSIWLHHNRSCWLYLQGAPTTASRHSCSECCVGPHQWPFKAVWNGNVGEEKRRRLLACSLNIFHELSHFQTEALCLSLKREPSFSFAWCHIKSHFSIWLHLSFLYKCTDCDRLGID